MPRMPAPPLSILRRVPALAIAAALCLAAAAHAAPPTGEFGNAPVDVRAFLRVPDGEQPTKFTEFRWPETRRPIQFEAADGLVLHGVFGRSPVRRYAPTAILLHDEGRDHTMFDQLGRELLDAGYNVLAFDLRGHGASTTKRDGTQVLVEEFSREHGTPQYGLMVEDLGAAVRWVREYGRTTGEIVLVGSRLGASIAGAGMPAFPREVRRAVLVSPIMFYRGINLREELGRIQGRPYLVLHAAADSAGIEAVRVFEQIGGSVRPKPMELDGVGFQLIDQQPVRGEIVEFLHRMSRHWPPPEGVPWAKLPRRLHM